jgi:hypothetical protein
MNISEIYQEIMTKHPDLVENILGKSSLESDSERQTIYGDLMDWLRDYYTIIPLADRSQVAKILLGEYVIFHPYCLQKVYIVLQESNVDGQMVISTTPCANLETAKKTMSQKVFGIINDGAGHFSGYCDSDYDEMFEVENTDTSFYINDPSDDYYEDIKIVEKVIVVR